LDLRHLAHFVRVAELGSFTKAAQMLHLAQSALTKQIHALEEELQQRLFERTGRGVVLTDAGRQLFVDAQAILSQVEQARRKIVGRSDQLTGQCVIGIPPSTRHAVTVPLFREQQREFPDARLTVNERLSGNILEQVAEGRFDIGLAYNARSSSAYESTLLLTENMYFVSPINSVPGNKALQPVSVAELHAYPIVLSSDQQTETSHHLLDSALSRAGVELKVVCEVGSTDATLDVVEAGLAHAVLPISVLRHRIDQFLLRTLVEPSLECTLSLVMTRRHPASQLTLRVAEIIKQSTKLANI
jgi:LysR family nitrogen assimilation transcriptional regulator